MDNYYLGTGIYEVTDPAVGVGMQGMSDDYQRTTGVESPLYSRAFIVEDREIRKRVVIVSADIWSCTMAVKRQVVSQLQDVCGKDLYTNDNVLVSGTHTHSGPGGYSQYYLYNHSMRGFDEHNFICIVSGIVKSIQKAHRNLVPGKIYVKTGKIPDCGRNRSPLAYANNSVSERQQFESDTDREMLLLKFVKSGVTGEQAVGILNWYAIHPTDRGQKTHWFAEIVKAMPLRFLKSLWEPTHSRMKHLSLLLPTPIAGTFLEMWNMGESPTVSTTRNTCRSTEKNNTAKQENCFIPR
jgi:neutral ceramidase